jgi:hypothetical protein
VDVLPGRRRWGSCASGLATTTLPSGRSSRRWATCRWRRSRPPPTWSRPAPHPAPTSSCFVPRARELFALGRPATSERTIATIWDVCPSSACTPKRPAQPAPG